MTHAVIRQLHKLMAYKDEYEVARLHLRPSFQEEVKGLFEQPRKVVYNFHPPLLRSFGLKRKLGFGPWFNPILGLLRGMKGLRGTPLDPFGYARVRREERRLIGWYKDLVESALEHLRSETYPLMVEIAELPDDIRGYEEIKLRNVEAAERRAEAMLRNLRESKVAAAVEAAS